MQTLAVLRTLATTGLAAAALLVAACGAEPPATPAEPPAAPAQPATPAEPPAARSEPVTTLAQALASESRSAEDRQRDAGSKPAEVIALLGIEPGMQVIDVIAGGGYYTEVLSHAVGPAGKVYSENPAAALEVRDGAYDHALTARLAGGRLANVVRLDREIGDTGIAAGSLDAAITCMNFHDVYNGRGAEAATGFLVAIKDLLKPGGVLGVIDHVGVAGADNTALHRIEESLVDAAAQKAGFTIEAKSDLLRNPADDHTKSVFDEGIRGKTDRFFLLLRKPA
jgi:predicted methyltransferase